MPTYNNDYMHCSQKECKKKDHGQGLSMVAPSLADSLGTYLCHRRWWNITTLKEIREGDVCEDFEFKTKKQ